MTITRVSRVLPPTSPGLVMPTGPPRRFCRVRLEGTENYVGPDGQPTTRDKAVQMSFAQAAGLYPRNMYCGQPVKIETCQVLTQDPDW